MSTELERQLGRAFDGLPEPSASTTGRVKAAALAALPPRSRRPYGRALIGLAAATAGVALAAAALAATGTLHVHVGARQQPRPVAPPALDVPAGTHGIALVAGGRLWLVTRDGLRIEGMPVSTAELSPRALYAVVGIGSSLVALAPGQRRAWTHPTRGRVVAAAWSPDGLKIAYVVATRAGPQLRLIEGDGDHDRLLDAHVSPAKPAWKPGSLRLVYLNAANRGTLLDLATGRRTRTRHVVRQNPAWDGATARAPRGTAVAVAAGARGMLELRIVRRAGARRSTRVLLRVRHVPPSLVTISWR